MPDKKTAASEEIAAPKEPKVRRVSNKIPRKSAKAPKPDTDAESIVPSEEFNPSPPEAILDSPEPASNAKRKNRRRRGKGKSKSEESLEAPPENKDDEKQNRPPDRPPIPPHKPRHKLDPGKIAKNAWKIYLAEVSEEGVALIGDNDARDLARRCFRLSEIFLEEAEKRA